MKLKRVAAFAAALSCASVSHAAITYNFVVTPVLDALGVPLSSNERRTFTFSIAADETPTYVAGLTNLNYRVKSYSYTEFGSTTEVVVPATLGKNVTFGDYQGQGGLALTNSGNRNFFLYNTYLYDYAAYSAAVQANPVALPTFYTGTFLLSTIPWNNNLSNPPRPIDNYRVTISAVDPEAAVPEAATWAMMLVGFGATGAVVRRRRKLAAA